MTIRPGDIISVYCVFINPPHYKYAVCVSPELAIFFFINTDKRRRTPDAQVLVSTSELPALKYDSYINTAEVVTFNQMHLSAAKIIDRLPDKVKERIKSVVATHKYLPPRYSALVFENL